MQNGIQSPQGEVSVVYQVQTKGQDALLRQVMQQMQRMEAQMDEMFRDHQDPLGLVQDQTREGAPLF